MPTSMPGVAHLRDGLDVVEVAVGREHPADAGGACHLEQQLVLVRGVDEDGFARARAPQHEDVVLVRPDDELVDADVGRFVVRGARHHGRGYRCGEGVVCGRRPGEPGRGGARGRAEGGGGAAAWKLDRSVKYRPRAMDFRDTPG